MQIIEPCCTQKHWPEIRNKIGKDGTTFFHGYGDLSITELFPVLMTPYSNTELLIVCPALPNATAEVITHWMEKDFSGVASRERVPAIASCTIITNCNAKKSPAAAKWLKENPWPERMKLHNIQQNDTAVMLPDLAIYGNINLVHSGHFTALASTNAKVIKNLRDTYLSLI